MGNYQVFQQCGFSPLLRCRPVQFALHSCGPANCSKGLNSTLKIQIPRLQMMDRIFRVETLVGSGLDCGVNRA
jgi:hypothetical protein